MNPEQEPCARCGHVPGGCPHCDRLDLMLGAAIPDENGTYRPYCHTYSPQPSCYTLTSWER
jgi:hypothetical protein